MTEVRTLAGSAFAVAARQSARETDRSPSGLRLGVVKKKVLIYCQWD